MRSYQTSSLASLASRKGRAKRNPEKYDEAERIQREYRFRRTVYRMDAWIRRPVPSFIVTALAVGAVFAPFFLA